MMEIPAAAYFTAYREASPQRAEERRRYTKETVWQNLKVFRLTLKTVDGQEI
jgi:hypothetical protein